jgi:oxaloacetate decarboxylase (Na+ extruding) subunit gamma
MDLSIADLLFSGVKLMFIGMGIVFFFLLLLVGVIQQTHAIMAHVEAKPARAARTRADAASGDALAADADLVAVVTAAIHHYETRTPQHQGVSNG